VYTYSFSGEANLVTVGGWFNGKYLDKLEQLDFTEAVAFYTNASGY
jgi:hypothetical protein